MELEWIPTFYSLLTNNPAASDVPDIAKHLGTLAWVLTQTLRLVSAFICTLRMKKQAQGPPFSLPLARKHSRSQLGPLEKPVPLPMFSSYCLLWGSRQASQLHGKKQFTSGSFLGSAIFDGIIPNCTEIDLVNQNYSEIDSTSFQSES